MTEQQRPITPPLELVGEWFDACVLEGAITYDEFKFAALAAQWGADQELKACGDALYVHEGQPISGGTAEWLLATRRSKPPNLKEQALKELEMLRDDAIQIGMGFGAAMSGAVTAAYHHNIRRALEALPND